MHFIFRLIALDIVNYALLVWNTAVIYGGIKYPHVIYHLYGLPSIFLKFIFHYHVRNKILGGLLYGFE